MLRWTVVFVCLVLAPEAAADSFTSGQQYYRAGLYDRAYELWSGPAHDGDATAQYALGVLYANGQGVERDKIMAARWYALAAAQGNEAAVTALRALSPELRDRKEAQHQSMHKASDGLPPVPVLKPRQRMFYVSGLPPVPAIRVARAPQN